MKRILLTIFFFQCMLTFGQTEFNSGFKNGYEQGYCHNRNNGCIKPIAPTPPIPNVNESLYSYKDGYNRGFEIGLKAQSSNNSNGNNRSRYQTAKPEYNDYTYKPNLNLHQKLANAQMKFQEKNQNRIAFLVNFLDEVIPEVKNIKGGYFERRFRREKRMLEPMVNDNLYTQKSRKAFIERLISIKNLMDEYEEYVNDNY
ncbi:hypothetical protein NACSLCCMFF_250024 [Tenacibaculum maritimum]|uniref:hypothetical protein n=1 Tax=Tenacibaculum maritimum TaxID=107401 RepID=UPI0012E6BA22|nr:hypothetical protein [Tenacibaculum maritimum]CAA0193489.1 hypothetical protein NACSLCCMFF_250024 [Tenacibaculum maritimum]